MIVHKRVNDGKISDFIDDITLETIGFSAPLAVGERPALIRTLAEIIEVLGKDRS